MRTTTGFGVRPGDGVEALERADTVDRPAYSRRLSRRRPRRRSRRCGRRRARRPSALGLHRRFFALATPACSTGAGRPRTGPLRRSWRRASRQSRSTRRRYVDEGAVMTSAGLSAGIDLCLHVIREDCGAAVGERVARHMVAAPHREGGQAQIHRASRGRRCVGPARWSRPGAGRPSACTSHSTSPRWRATPASARAPSPAAFARRPGRRRCSGCSIGACRRRGGCSRRPICRSTQSPGGPASAPPPRCATTSAAPPRRRRPPTGAPSRRSRLTAPVSPTSPAAGARGWSGQP